MLNPYSITVLTLLLSSCAKPQLPNQSIYQLVGGPCEGCEAIFEFAEQELAPVDTLPDYYENGQKIKLTGTIYQNDGKTPAEGVILYIYHTDQAGVYAAKSKETGWAKRHGYNRGWIKTDRNGEYAFYTLKPGIYPDGSEPAHIHPTILEPNGKYYWLESFYFQGDTLLSSQQINPDAPRGGSKGLLLLRNEGTIWVGKRDFILGKNVPNYE